MDFKTAPEFGDLVFSAPPEADADRFPAKVLDSDLVISKENYQKVVDVLGGFTVSTTFGGFAYTMAKVAFADIASTSINELDAELRAAAQYIANGYIRVLGRLGPWYWFIHDGKVAVEQYGDTPVPTS